ncbi:MAG: stage III sporulation protein AE [Alicyclobacillus sp.]|nr:stage III sporulation protein AE [Alicyclobacillus sp.]
MRRVFAACLILFALLVGAGPSAFADTAAAPPPVTAASETPPAATPLPSSETLSQSVQADADQQLDSLPTDVLQSFWNDLEREYGGYLPDVHSTSIVRQILDSGGWTFQGVTHGIIRYFFAEIFDNVQLIGAILLLSVLAVVLKTVQTAFEQNTVSQVANAVVLVVLIGLAVGSFTEAVGYARHAIQSMTDFMLATVPLVVTLVAASGAVASAAFFQPMLLFTVHLVSNVVFLLVFPMVFFSALLDLVSALSPRYQLTRLAGLFRTIGVVVLGVSLSVFLGITTVEGIGKGLVDGVTMRTARFAVKAMVPVIGSALSDATEAIASASMLVKNAVGISGLLIVAFLALFPAIKILVLSLLYGGSAALIQPLGDGPMVDTLAALGKSFVLILASVLTVALMFFMAICILLLTANLTVVMT